MASKVTLEIMGKVSYIYPQKYEYISWDKL